MLRMSGIVWRRRKILLKVSFRRINAIDGETVGESRSEKHSCKNRSGYSLASLWTTALWRGISSDIRSSASSWTDRIVRSVLMGPRIQSMRTYALW